MDPDNDDAPTIADRPFLITFSGIDGAGKTTQIDLLTNNLQKQGLRVVRFTFWDDVAVWSKIRAEVGYRSTDSRCGGGAPRNTFVPKNNKHVHNWYLSAARSGLYVADIVRLRRLLNSSHVRNFDVMIFDRYVYDQIANIYSGSWTARVYGRMLLKKTPVPDLAFILDASPDAAFARKPEYPLMFMHKNRRSFLRLRELVPQLIVIPDAPPDEVHEEISLQVRHSSLAYRLVYRANTGIFEQSSVVPGQSCCRVQNEPTTSI